MKRIYLVSIIFLGGLLSTNIIAQEIPDKIDKYIEDFRQDLDIVSMSVALVKADEVVWTGAFGKSNIEKDINATTKDLYCLGSVSKLYTGATLLKLYEEGKLKLDDDVNNYLPYSVRNPKYPETSITFRMLLTHTSSIGDDRELMKRLYVDGDPEMSLYDVTNNFLNPKGEYYRTENFHEFKPGSKWEYSNWNFVLIGCIIERISGKSFTDYSHEVLIDPLEMKNSGWFIREIDKEKMVTMYSKLDSGKVETLDPDYGWPGYSDGNLRTNIEEAANFLAMILNNGKFNGKQILKAETIAEMRKPQGVNTPYYLKDMALVWHIEEQNALLDDSNIVYIHSGSPTGSIMTMYFMPETNSGFITLINGVDIELLTYEKYVALNMYLVKQAGNFKTENN